MITLTDKGAEKVREFLSAQSSVAAVDHGALDPHAPPHLASRIAHRLHYVLGSIPGLGALFHDETAGQRVRAALRVDEDHRDSIPPN